MYRHLMGKRSRTPSVETRVVQTKEKLSGSLEKLFLLYLHLLYSVFISYLFTPSLLLLLFFTLFYTNLFSFGVRLFLTTGYPEGTVILYVNSVLTTAPSRLSMTRRQNFGAWLAQRPSDRRRPIPNEIIPLKQCQVSAGPDRTNSSQRALYESRRARILRS